MTTSRRDVPASRDRRLCRPSAKAAALMLALASDVEANVTGAEFRIDGGPVPALVAASRDLRHYDRSADIGTIVFVVFFLCTEVPMAARPHDITDLYLAPVVLAVDARIEELGQLDEDELAYEVGLESDAPDFTRDMREGALIRTLTHLIDCHDWEFSWDPRGLRLTHDEHTLVLGVPGVIHKYLEASPK